MGQMRKKGSTAITNTTNSASDLPAAENIVNPMGIVHFGGPFGAQTGDSEARRSKKKTAGPDPPYGGPKVQNLRDFDSLKIMKHVGFKAFPSSRNAVRENLVNPVVIGHLDGNFAKSHPKV